jgi:hypothetical protein
MTKPANFTKAAVVRALRAAAAANAKMMVEIRPDGTICLVPHELREAQPTAKRQLAIPKGFYL